MAEAECVKGHDWAVVSRNVSTVVSKEGTTIVTTVEYECKRCTATNTVTSEKSG